MGAFLSKSALRLFAAISVSCCLTTLSHAVTFVGPSPYLSSADAPAGFYTAGPTSLEDFEDGTLDFGITATSDGSTTFVNPGQFTDSVDADDGTIDNNGNAGHSFAAFGAATQLTFSFAGPLPIAAGLVYTDAAPEPSIVTLEAFGPGMVSLGTYGPFNLGDPFAANGSTTEDRFLGAKDAGGIAAIRVYFTQSNGFEVDHVQYEVPEPGSVALLAGVGAAMALRRGRRRCFCDMPAL